MTIKRKVSKKSGFTLIEMIGVLAIIAILTALLLPKIFQVINDSRISNTLASYNSAKAGTAALYGKLGRWACADGTDIEQSPNWTSPIMENWDDELVKGGYLETRFAVKIGNGRVGFSAGNPAAEPPIPDTEGSRLRIISLAGVLANVAATRDNGAYNLLPDSGSANDVTGSYVVEAVIPGVTLQDAEALDERIDGDTGAESRATVGRVKFFQNTQNAAVQDVIIYVAHR